MLKEAADKSCSVTEPLIAIGRCRERETPIAEFIWLAYRDGRAGIAKDPVQQAYWRRRYDECIPVVDRINRQRGCIS